MADFYFKIDVIFFNKLGCLTPKTVLTQVPRGFFLIFDSETSAHPQIRLLAVEDRRPKQPQPARIRPAPDYYAGKI